MGGLRYFGTTLALAIGLTGSTFAQAPAALAGTEPTAAKPQNPAGPGSAAWPGQPSQPLPAPTPMPGTTAPAPVPHPPPTPLLESQATPYMARDPEALPAALPGTLEDQVGLEYEYRKLFQYCTWRGSRLTLFPSSLLWTPPMAAKWEPRMQALPQSLDNYSDQWTLDVSIGGTVGILRREPIGRDFAWQFDIFAVVHSRLSPDDLVATDYRYGLPISWRWGVWHGKFAYEHTSAHIGDEFIRANNPVISGYTRDEVTVGVGRYFLDMVRLYGQIGYGFNRSLPQPLPPAPPVEDGEPWRFDAGVEWATLRPTGWGGAPFFAFHLQARGDQDYEANVTAQLGWMWRNPHQRLANLRVFLEYYSGYSPYGQFYLDRERFYGVGLAGDF